MRERNPHVAAALRNSDAECQVRKGKTWRGAIEADEAEEAEHKRLMALPLPQFVAELSDAEADRDGEGGEQ